MSSSTASATDLPLRRPESPVGFPEVRTGRLVLHLFLLLLTAGTTFVAGVFFVLPEVSIEQGAFLLTHPYVLSSGLAYSCTLLTILLAHELGHYFACRHYGIRATLPFFLPGPPFVGTFGAFIRIKEPIQSRRALFDIGIAGPLAGFAVALPAALVGLWMATPAPPPLTTEGSITFNDPVLFIVLQRLFDWPVMIEWNPMYFAAWVGLLATSLNLLPVGQLDGGHVAYAVLGPRGHHWMARGIFFVMLFLAVVSYTRHRWIGWFIYVGLLGLLIGLKHPPLQDEAEPLDRRRKMIALVGLIVFILSFMPFPITFR